MTAERIKLRQVAEVGAVAGTSGQPEIIASRRFTTEQISLVFSICAKGAKVSLEAMVAETKGRGPKLSERLAETFPDLFDCLGGKDIDIGAQFGERIFGELFAVAADGAGDNRIVLQPSDRYRELMAFIASELCLETVDIHGWPILSSVGATAEDAEAGRESILPGGGAA